VKIVRAFLTAPTGIFGLACIAVIIVVALVAPRIWGDSALEMNVFALRQQPSPAHWLGTDQLGRDILQRILVATSTSMKLAFLAVLVSALTGPPLGATLALMPPRVRSVGLRVIDLAIAFPGLILSLYIIGITGPGEFGAVLGTGLGAAAGLARVTSTLAMSVRGRGYVQAAQVLGVPFQRKLTRYILANIADVLLISLTVSVSAKIVALAGLSFLGLGVQPPAYDWGRMLTEGVSAFYATPLAALGPAAAIAFTAMAFGLTGEAMARAANPVVWTARHSLPNFGPLVRRAPAPPLPRSGAAPSHVRADAVPTPAMYPSGAPLLEVCGLSVRFPTSNGTIQAVDNVSFTLREGEILGIVGESGSGKTTTALAIAQLVPYPGEITGAIKLHGQELRELKAFADVDRDKFMASRMAMVYQDPMSSLNPALTLGLQMTEEVRIHRGLSTGAANALALDRFREVQLPAPELQVKRYPHELSGGMRQRAMIAMGLMNDVELLIADEPTTALDVTVQAQIMKLLSDTNRKHRTAVILVSHNIALVRQTCDRVLVMYAGHVVEELPAGLLGEDARHPYTRALLGAVPDMETAAEQPLTFIPGQAPNMASLPPGCPFHPRCAVALERCRTDVPSLAAVNGHLAACWVAQGELEKDLEPDRG
jgi:oligopeptide/dipeptide ABC transporter ATP-binding protein